MKKRMFAILTALTMLCSIVLPITEAKAAEVESATDGTTYYVSTIHGKDTNNGKSEKTPFYSLQKINDLPLKAGDKVLLECGSVFRDGYLHLYEKSGSADAPIVIDRYGTGSNPVIDTNGQGIWYQNYGYRLDSATHVKNGYVSSSILLYDTQYIEINHLEIVNDATDIEADDYREAYVMDRTGVAAVAQNKGTLEHIRLNGLKIHDVYGNVYNKHMNNGGIYFTVFAPQDSTLNNNEIVTEKEIPRYHDVLIENCVVDTANRWGIAVGYTAYWYKFPDSKSEIPDDTIQQYGSTEVVIRNNYIKDVGGDAITTMYCDRPLIEYNVSDATAQHMNTEVYTNPAGRGGRVAAAIWPWKCKNAVFQYNEVFDTKGGQSGNGDAQAWDADSGDGTLYQYNYSHGNTGGCVMFCYPKAYHNTFRYNISQNDLWGMLDISSNPDANVYNNVFYIAEGVDFIRSDHANGSMKVENNIIYYAGATKKTENWRNTTNRTYSNNLYYNYANTPDSDISPVKVSAGTQIFKDPGKAPSSTTEVAHLHDDPAVKSIFDGYKLAEDSPAIGRGKAVTDYDGISASEKDFFGNDVTKVTTLDIGAHQHQEDEDINELLPPSPQKAEPAEVTENAVTIRWQPVWDTTVEGYLIQVLDAEGNEILTEDIENLTEITDPETGMLSYSLKDLEAGKSYTVAITAYDTNCESKPLSFVFETKAEDSQTSGDNNGDENGDDGNKGEGATKKNPSIRLDLTSTTIYTKVETTVTLKATVIDLDGAAVNWTSSNPEVADVANGVVTAGKAGEAVITAKAGNCQASCTVTVKEPSITVKKSLKLKKGKKAKLKVTVVPTGKISYKSSNKKIAKVTQKGVVKGIKKGSCKITVKCNGVKKTVKVKVK